MLPQLILSLLFSCVNISLKWFLRFNIAANLIIYLPQAATFFLFILPSSFYFEVFQTKSYFGKLVSRYCRPNNIIAPQIATIIHFEKRQEE
jgi:hypothetical protein